MRYNLIKIEKNCFEKRSRKSVDHAVRNSFKSFRSNERDRRDVNEQLKRNQCVFNEFCENKNENKHENKQDKKTLWIKKEEFDENNVINDINEVVRFDKKRNASWMQWWNEKIKLWFEKTDNKIEKIIRKLKRITEKTINTTEENIWAKITFKNVNIAFSTLSMLAINAFLKETMIQQKNEINNIN